MVAGIRSECRPGSNRNADRLHPGIRSPYPTISLALAREQAGSANTQVASGIDPISARKKSVGSGAVVTFGDAATNLLAALRGGWKNPKHHQQWTNTLATHVASLWNRPIDQIGAQHVLDVLAPIWTQIPETASRVRGRIERVLNAAKARGLRMGENPARWNDHLSILLPARTKLTVLYAQNALPRGTGDFVFPGAKEGRPLSNMSMQMVLRRMNERSVTVHGFRSSFRDWAGELTDHARETAEAALAHAVGNEVEVAYRRGTSIDKRVTLMQDWADYLAVEV